MKNIILALLALVAGCSAGTHKVTGVIGPAFSRDQVVIFYSTPKDSKTVGQVSAHSLGGLIFHDAGDEALNEVKLQASKLGANGIVLYNFDSAPPWGAYVRGMAIFVSR